MVSHFGAISPPVASGTVVVCKNNTRVLGRSGWAGTHVEKTHKHNSTMVSDASPGNADQKMNEPFVHTVHTSSDHARTQDGYFKRPHLTIIDGDMKWDSGWFSGGFGVVGHLTRA